MPNVMPNFDFCEDDCCSCGLIGLIGSILAEIFVALEFVFSIVNIDQALYAAFDILLIDAFKQLFGTAIAIGIILFIVRTFLLFMVPKCGAFIFVSSLSLAIIVCSVFALILVQNTGTIPHELAVANWRIDNSYMYFEYNRDCHGLLEQGDNCTNCCDDMLNKYIDKRLSNIQLYSIITIVSGALAIISDAFVVGDDIE